MVSRSPRTLWILLGVVPVCLYVLFISVWNRHPDPERSTALKVYSYSSFMSPWGPGPELARKFQDRTGVAVQLIDVGDSQAIVERLRFRSPKEVVDVVLGLDQLALSGARRALQWRKPKLGKIPWDLNLPKDYILEDLTPLQWAPLSFLHRGGYGDVHTLKDLLDVRFRSGMILLDPRTSTPGYQFLSWIVQTLGEEQALSYLSELRKNIHSVQSSWSTGYSLFHKGEAGAIFTYVTSAAYHWTEEQDLRYQPIRFSEGLPFQVEYIGIPETCRQCEAAEEFVNFLLEPDSQRLIMTKNYMLPVVSGVQELVPEFQFEGLQLMQTPLADSLEVQQRKLLGLWKKLGM